MLINNVRWVLTIFENGRTINENQFLWLLSFKLHGIEFVSALIVSALCFNVTIVEMRKSVALGNTKLGKHNHFATADVS